MKLFIPDLRMAQFLQPWFSCYYWNVNLGSSTSLLQNKCAYWNVNLVILPYFAYQYVHYTYIRKVESKQEISFEWKYSQIMK